MYFFKVVDGNYITAIGKGNSGTEITEAEYNEIISIIQTAPKAPDGKAYRLKTDLTWELYAVEPQPEPEPTAEEALSILLGGAV